MPSSCFDGRPTWAGSEDEDRVVGGLPGGFFTVGTVAGADDECGSAGTDALWDNGGDGGLYFSMSRRSDLRKSQV